MPQSILASLTGLGTDRIVMETAIAAARIQGGHITCLHARVDALGAAQMVETMFPQSRFEPGQIRAMSQEDTERTAHARAAFDHAVRQHGLSVCDAPGEAPVSLAWLETRSVVDETVEEAWYHDLVVMAREPELAGERIGSVLMQSGRPLLLAPPKPEPILGRNIAIAWKAGAQSARAVTAASSWLERAERIFILNVTHHAAGDDRDRLSAERLAASLRWRGIEAEVQVKTDHATGPEARTLQNMACDKDADLLVMGAYGHSRLREYVMGGVTQSMLEGSVLPVLMVS
jgi:nucleotide-binding universal stress UspA family protein